MIQKAEIGQFGIVVGEPVAVISATRGQGASVDSDQFTVTFNNAEGASITIGTPEGEEITFDAADSETWVGYDGDPASAEAITAIVDVDTSLFVTTVTSESDLAVTSLDITTVTDGPDWLKVHLSTNGDAEDISFDNGVTYSGTLDGYVEVPQPAESIRTLASTVLMPQVSSAAVRLGRVLQHSTFSTRTTDPTTRPRARFLA